MRILTSPATDGSGTEDADPCDGVDPTTSMGRIETTARSPRKHQDSADSIDYDRYRPEQPLSTLSDGDPVWVHDARIEGTVVGKDGTPRSCLVRPRRHVDEGIDDI